ncbi:FAD-dependent oxidoreductase [Adhaeribacter aquaticus]|uniref:FAD-dependent oxidoreductase n=1 Tax=Adhaeribacter aquaticus TaxID=299567 RepID=UPI000405B3C2|nr:FAD-dependent oxidoreductase [Adhaeribacter aquaticus]
MKKNTGSTLSPWMHGTTFPVTTALTEDLTCDVCVVGAGIAGMTTAYLLAQEGKSVVVLESKGIGSGETSRTTAHLSNAFDDRYHIMVDLIGEKKARILAESHTYAIKKIEEICATENIDCDFERLNGYLFLQPSSTEDQLDKELAAARQLGFANLVKLKNTPIPSLSNGPCLCFPDQAIFHPLKYLVGLSHALLAKGGKIFTDSHVISFEKGLDHIVRTSGGFTVTAKQVVVATNSPVNDTVAIHTKQAPYRTYVIGFKVLPGTIPNGLYWDDSEPYHYIRLVKDTHPDSLQSGEDAYNLLIVGGEDHKTGQEENEQERLECLEEWVREKLPMAGDVVYRWSGQVMEPTDYVAYIGKNPGEDNVYIATGDSGQGMTHGTIAGVLITDLIMGRPNAWANVYDPGRIRVKSAPEFLKENLNVAAQYKDWVTPGEVTDPSEIMPGTGRVIRRGINKVAVYCDALGQKHEMSAVCSHMGCIVNWNEVENTWDCPCHGSRFDATGEVLSGPAIKGLGKPE